jgi:hypothetical protein
MPVRPPRVDADEAAAADGGDLPDDAEVADGARATWRDHLLSLPGRLIARDSPYTREWVETKANLTTLCSALAQEEAVPLPPDLVLQMLMQQAAQQQQQAGGVDQAIHPSAVESFAQMHAHHPVIFSRGSI